MIKFAKVCIALALTIWLDAAYTADHSFKFIALSDVHFDPYAGCQENVKPCELLEKLRQSPVSKWDSLFLKYDTTVASYQKDTDFSLLNTSMLALKTSAKQVKIPFVLVLGDYLAHGSRDKFSLYSSDASNHAYQLFMQKTYQFITHKLHYAFNFIDVYMAVGNNDSYDNNYVIIPNGAFFRDTADAWSRLISDKVQAGIMRQQFSTMGYYAINPPGQKNLRIIILNTVPFSSRVESQGLDTYNLQELNWFADELQAAQTQHQKVILAYHIPDTVDVFLTLKEKPYHTIELWKPEISVKFEALLQRYSSTLIAIFVGHSHVDRFHLIKIQGSYLPVIGVPSISPVYGNNPGYKIVNYDQSQQSIKDFTMYYEPLNASLSWEKEYDFRQVYCGSNNACDLLEGMQALQNTGDLSKRYQYYYGVGVGDHPIMQSWLPYYWCTIHTTSQTDYESCVKESLKH